MKLGENFSDSFPVNFIVNARYDHRFRIPIALVTILNHFLKKPSSLIVRLRYVSRVFTFLNLKNEPEQVNLKTEPGK